jgi:RNA recognition motif-containing protein
MSSSWLTAKKESTSGASKPSDDATVFVRNLPFDMNDAALSSLFGKVFVCESTTFPCIADCGPVRRAFVVKEKVCGNSCRVITTCDSFFVDLQAGAHGSRGFGFVQFALAADALEAVTSFSGKDIQGRKLNVEVAKNVPKHVQAKVATLADEEPEEVKRPLEKAGTSYCWTRRNLVT